MRFTELNEADMPRIILRAGSEPAKDVALQDLSAYGNASGPYTVSVGDTIQMPADEEDVVLKAVPVNGGSQQIIVGVFKNGKPAWFGLNNLRRQDAERQPVHAVAKELDNKIKSEALSDNYQTRLKACLGRTIVATRPVTYNETVFVDQRPTDKVQARTVAFLEFEK